MEARHVRPLFDPLETRPLPGHSRARIFTLLASSSLTVMAAALVAPSLPGVERAYAHVPSVGLLARLVLTLPALAIAVAGPLAGWSVDRLGRKQTLVASLALFAVAGSTGLYLPGIYEVLAGRAVLGLAVSGLMTAATTLIADLFTGPARGRLLSWQAAFMGVGGTIFLLAGGALADLSWRAPFALYLASVLLIPLALVTLPRGAGEGASQSPLEPDHRSPDEAPWGKLVLLYTGAVIAMLAFFLVPVQSPFLLASRLGAQGLGIGAAVAVMAVVSALGSLQAPRMLDHLGHLGTLATTFVLVSVGELGLVFASSWLPVLLSMAAVGFGLGLVMPNLSLWVTRLAPLAVRGRALGGLTTSLFLGQFLSPIAVGPLTAAGPEVGSAHAFLAGAILAGVGTLVCLSAALMARHRRRGASSPPAAGNP